MPETGITKLADLVNPEVMADMISATLPKKIKFSPIAKIDTTLVGRPGDTITIPKFAYIGDATDVAEGEDIPLTKLAHTTAKVTIKKAGKGVELTDEALLSGYGDPMGEAVKQLSMAIASKIDEDCYAVLCGATLKFDGSAGVIAYRGIVDAVDLLADESDTTINKYIFVNPAQITTLRKDADFLDLNKYPITGGVIMTGTIGTVAGCRVVVSKRVAKNKEGTAWLNPLVVVDTADPNEDPAADSGENTDSALTIYMKRSVQVETDRDIIKKLTVATADEHYVAALSNASKVVLASFKA